MTEVLRMSRKALTMGVVLTTIAWSMMASVLVAPLSASAAGCTSGSLIKGSLAAVYYCGADGKRYVFPNEKSYKTWYADFSSVVKISDADLANIQIGGNVTYRPGVKMVKITTDPKVYAIAKGGVLRHVPSEACAVTLYGATWNQQIEDVPDAFFTNYTVGSAINGTCSDYNKTSEMSMSQSINQDKNLSSSGTTSGLSVSLASDTPSSATVPKSANGVNFTKFNVSNPTGSSAMIDTVVVRRVGAGAPGDFSAVYLYEGNARLTTGRTVNSSTNEVSFNSLNWTVAPGQTRTFWVSGTMSSTAGAGNVNAFEVKSVMSGNANAVGVPVQGNFMTVASATVGSITISKTGSITNPKVGQMGAKVAEFQLAAGAAEDLDLKRITLFQGGSLSRSNLSNLKLKAGGTEVASAMSVDEKDRVTFVLTQANLLEKGNTRNFEVWADIGSGARANDTIRLYVEEDSDVWAQGRTYGYGASVVRTSYDNGSNDGTDASWSTVEGGQVTITFNGPSAKDIATNAKDQEVLNFTIVSQVNVEVRNLRLNLIATGIDNSGGLVNTTANPDVANYTDIKVTDVASNVIVSSPQDVSITGADDDQDLVYTDTFNLNAGQARTFKVTLDVANQSALAGDTIRVILDPFQSSDIRNLENSTYVSTSDIVPSSTIQGNAHTIREATLTLSAATNPLAQTYIQGSQNVELMGLNLKASDAQDLRVTSITLTGRVDANNDGTFANACESSIPVTNIVLTAKLMDGNAQVGDLKSPTTVTCGSNAGGLLQFTNLNLPITKGQTKTLKLVGNLASSIASLNDTIDFQVLATSDVVAQDAVDGNSVTVSGTVDGNNMLIASSGSMTYTRAPDDPESEAGLAIGGTNAVLAKYRFTAQNEDMKLTKVRMALVVGSATAINSLSLYDGAQQVAAPVAVTISGTTTYADFSGVNFMVSKDTSKTLTVKADLAQVGGASGAASGSDLTVTLCNGDSVTEACGADSNTFEVRGTSAGSSTIDTMGNSGDIAGNEKRIRKTKPTVTMALLPTSTLSNGTQVISQFTVSADAAQQVSLKGMAFEINLNNVGGLGLVLSAAGGATDSGIREVGQTSDVSGTSTFPAACNTSSTTTCTARVSFTNEVSIAAGTSKTFQLRATVTGADSSGESISTKLLGDTAQVTGELDGATTLPAISIDDLDQTAAAGSYNFIWSDNSAIPHNDTRDTDANLADDSAASNDWTNGRFVKILPSDAQTMSRS